MTKLSTISRICCVLGVFIGIAITFMACGLQKLDGIAVILAAGFLRIDMMGE